MSKAALLIELGWEPINAFLNRQRASYFSYINNLPNKRLCKIVFDEMHALSGHAWDYLPALKTVTILHSIDTKGSNPISKI